MDTQYDLIRHENGRCWFPDGCAAHLATNFLTFSYIRPSILSSDECPPWDEDIDYSLRRLSALRGFPATREDAREALIQLNDEAMLEPVVTRILETVDVYTGPALFKKVVARVRWEIYAFGWITEADKRAWLDLFTIEGDVVRLKLVSCSRKPNTATQERIEAFLGRVAELAGVSSRRITKKVFWQLAGFDNRSSFEAYQREDPDKAKCSDRARDTFDRLVAAGPLNFLETMRSKSGPVRLLSEIQKALKTSAARAA